MKKDPPQYPGLSFVQKKHTHTHTHTHIHKTSRNSKVTDPPFLSFSQSFHQTHSSAFTHLQIEVNRKRKMREKNEGGPYNYNSTLFPYIQSN